MTLSANQDALTSIFTDDELLVLCSYLRVEVPAHLDPRTFGKERRAAPGFDEDWYESDSALVRLRFTEKRHLQAAWWVEREAAAVASILLQSVQDRLPHWGAWDGEKAVPGRETYLRPRGREPRLVQMPQLLFSVDWAVTAPGISWPQAYHLTWVPMLGRFVVTVSCDTRDLLGYSDVAVDSFADTLTGEALIERAIGSVVEYRGYLENDGLENGPAELLGNGLVGRRRARKACHWGC